MGVFSAHVAHDCHAKTVELSAKIIVQRRRRFIQVETTPSMARMANNQLPPCTFSTSECLQWWAFTMVNRHPLQDFGPEKGEGVYPKLTYTPNHTVLLHLPESSISFLQGLVDVHEQPIHSTNQTILNAGNLCKHSSQCLAQASGIIITIRFLSSHYHKNKVTTKYSKLPPSCPSANPPSLPLALPPSLPPSISVSLPPYFLTL